MKIEIRTGSDSDIPKLKDAYAFLQEMGVPFTPRILSAHRLPQDTAQATRQLAEDGFLVCIAAAGGAAHLAGITAAETIIPVIGLPIMTAHLDGQDSLYSTIQMPEGIPVATVGIEQAKSAATLAIQIAYNQDAAVRSALREHKGIETALTRLPDQPIVGILQPERIEYDKAKYPAMLSTLDRMGITYLTTQLTCTDELSVQIAAANMEQQGAAAIIALGEVTKSYLTNHVPGLASAATDLPVIGLPITKGYAGDSSRLEGDIFARMLLDDPTEESPRGFPVAGMGINRYLNAALFAAQIVGLFHPNVQQEICAYRQSLADAVRQKDQQLREQGIEAFLTSS